MKKKIMLLAFVATLLLTSCSGKGSTASTSEQVTGEQVTGEQATGEQNQQLPENMSYAKLPEDVAIRIDGEDIKKADVDFFYNIVRKQAIADSGGEEALKKIGPTGVSLEDYIKQMANERMIMFHLMKKENPSLTVKDEDVDKKLKEIEKDEGKDKLEKDLKEAGISLDECKFLIKQSLYEEAFYADYFKKNPISEEQIKSVFVMRLEEMPTHHAKHILVETEEEAKAILKDLEAGKDFAEIAKEKSKDPGSADRGGDLGFNAPKLFVPEFADALKKLEVGKISEPVKTQFGYHIIKLEEKKENYEDFKEQIQAQMEKESYNAYILGIFKKAKIELAK